MRVSREKAQENRERIVAAAAALFRERGFDGVGVDAIMEKAGLTHGGFYKHFKSKEALAVEALEGALADTFEAQKAFTTLGDYVRGYLSPENRDEVAAGCAITAMSADAARREDLRRPMGDNVRAQIESIAALLATKDKAEARAEAIATLSTMVGALALSRAVDDPALSNEILATSRAKLGA